MTTYLDNLLGAVGLALADRIEAEAEAVAGGERAAGALVLLALRPRMTIKRLAERLRLTHPGAVRLVDRLEGGGLVRREVGEDRRSVRLSLTNKGEAAVEGVRRARATTLAAVTGVLSAQDRAVLEPILERLAHALTTDLVSAYANCRLCDTPICEARGCPVEAEARAKFGPPAAVQPIER